MDPSDLELIRGVRATPALFDPANSDFKFAYRKEKIWIELSQYLGINMNDARRRWTCLRDKYTRELKSRRLNPNMQYQQDDFYKEMDFLRPFVRKRKQRNLITCKIKSNTTWDGKLENYSYNTCDSSYSNTSNYKGESSKSDTNATLNKSYSFQTSESNYPTKIISKLDQQQQQQQNTTVDEVNVEEILRGYQVEKVDGGVAMVIDTTNDGASEEIEEDEAIVADENYEEYQVQLSSDNESQTHIAVQSCNMITAQQTVEVPSQNQQSNTSANTSATANETAENEDDFFCKSVSIYLRQLSRVHKIKAKVDIFKILQKYIEIEENVNN